MQIKIIEGDILNVACDAIVDPTDVNLSGSGGLDKIIHMKAGSGLEAACVKLRGAGLRAGQAEITDGYDLKIPYIIHAAAPRWEDGGHGEMEALAECYWNIMDAASKKREIRILAVPSIATGTGGYPLGGLTSEFGGAEVVALETINRFLHQRRYNRIHTVLIVCRSKATFEAYKSTFSAMFGNGIPKRERIRGALLGGAVGEALGYPVRFEKGWKACIEDYVLDDGMARIAYGTQMTMFAACGLLYGMTRLEMRGIGAELWTYISRAYLDWHRTQAQSRAGAGGDDQKRDGAPENGGNPPERGTDAGPEPGSEADNRVSWLLDLPEMYACRGAEEACLEALKAGGGSLTAPPNDSQGCGGVVSIAPIPLYLAAHTDADQKTNATDCAAAAAVTHGHPLGWLSAAALGNILFDLMQNFSLRFAVRDTIRFLERNYSGYPDVKRQIELIRTASSIAGMSGYSSSANIMMEFDGNKNLGEGWTGEEALAIGLCCALDGKGFDRNLLNAVGHHGNSASTASIAGQIMGALWGPEAIPAKWLEPLELRDTIEELAGDLAQGCLISEYSSYSDPVWEVKYLYRRAADKIKKEAYVGAWVPWEDGPDQESAEKPSCNTWIVFHEDGTAEGYYRYVSYQLLPDSVNRMWHIVGNVGKNPWIGTVRRQFDEWGNPYRIEIRSGWRGLLAPVAEIVADRRFREADKW